MYQRRVDVHTTKLTRQKPRVVSVMQKSLNWLVYYEAVQIAQELFIHDCRTSSRSDNNIMNNNNNMNKRAYFSFV